MQSSGKPIFLVRHSERMDEVLQREDFDRLLSRKLHGHKEGLSDREKALSELHFDPTLPRHIREKLSSLRGAEGTEQLLLSLSPEERKAALPFLSLYAHCRPHRCAISTHCDAAITRRGVSIAKCAARSLSAMLQHEMTSSSSSSSSSSPPVLRLYCSRLQRCVQTAYVLARKLGVDALFVSTGLALTAAAVEREGVENFDFLDFHEISRICEGITVVDCDTGSVFRNGEPVPERVSENVKVDAKDWRQALADVAQHTESVVKITAERSEDDVKSNESSEDGGAQSVYKVVVIHRETIRNLLPFYERMRLPYCCIARCAKGELEGEEDLQKKRFPLKLLSLQTPEGKYIKDLSKHWKEDERERAAGKKRMLESEPTMENEAEAKHTIVN